MRSVPIQELKQHLSALIDLVDKGERIVITRHRRPVATLAPPPLLGVRVGSRSGRGSLESLPALADAPSIVATLAADRERDR